MGTLIIEVSSFIGKLLTILSGHQLHYKVQSTIRILTEFVIRTFINLVLS